jgi:hypothetical protein
MNWMSARAAMAPAYGRQGHATNLIRCHRDARPPRNLIERHARGTERKDRGGLAQNEHADQQHGHDDAGAQHPLRDRKELSVIGHFFLLNIDNRYITYR